jgi:excisionase family DNA binding protein
MKDKLYLTVDEAAEYVGIGRNAMYDYLNSANPPPFLRVGNKRLLQKAALADYFEERQEVKR